MEPFIYAWLPPKCYYHDLTSSLDPIFENRQYFRDEAMTQQITTEQLYKGEVSKIFMMKYGPLAFQHTPQGSH